MSKLTSEKVCPFVAARLYGRIGVGTSRAVVVPVGREVVPILFAGVAGRA